MDKKKLLEDLLQKSVAIRVETNSAEKKSNDEENICELFKNSTIYNNCLICGTEYKKEVPPILFRPLTEKERKLLRLADPGHFFLCQFCSSQIEKLKKLREKIGILQREFDTFLGVIKTVSKMGCVVNYEDDEEYEPENGSLYVSENESQDCLNESCNISSSFAFGNQLLKVKEEVEDVLVEPEWLFELDGNMEAISKTECTVNVSPEENSSRKQAKKRKNLSKSNSETVFKTRSRRKRLTSPNTDLIDEADHFSNYSPTQSSDEEEEDEDYKPEGRKRSRKDEILDNEDNHIICDVCEVTVSKEKYKRHTHGWKHFVEEECKEAAKQKENVSSNFFLCSHCDSDSQTFPSLEDLRSHYNSSHEKGLIFCKPCGKTVTNGWSNYRKHVRREKHLILKNTLNQTEEEIRAKLPFECLLCLQRFTNEKSLNRHMNMHKPNAKDETTPSICETCGRSFATVKWLKRHQKAAHKDEFPDSKNVLPNETEKVKCPNCPKVYTSRTNMQEHNRKIHLSLVKRCYKRANKRVRDRKGKVPCPIPSCCGKEVIQPRFYAHLEVKHFQPWDLGGCECPFECGRSFDSETEWVQHVNNCCIGKESSEKSAKCLKCNIIFPSQFTRFSHHLQSHPETAVACEFCSRPFTTAAALLMHVPIHPESRPHLCTKCGKSFRFLATFHGHQRSVCNDDEEDKKAFIEKQREKQRQLREKGKNFKCPECHRGFANERRVKEHFEKNHPGIQMSIGDSVTLNVFNNYKLY